MDLNEGFIINTSEIFCYSPIFGYLLEKLPKTKIIGNNQNYNEPLRLNNDKYNLFKPMCFLFPTENNCDIGETFSIDEKNKLIKFSEYKNFEFKKSKIQKLADYSAVISFFVLVICSVVISILYLKKKNYRIIHFSRLVSLFGNLDEDITSAFSYFVDAKYAPHQ